MYDEATVTAYAYATVQSQLPAIQSTAMPTTYTAEIDDDIPDGHIDYKYIPWGNITGNINDQLDLAAALKQLQDEIDEAIAHQLGTVFTYKGQVDTYNYLPTDAKIGDCYNVNDTGANYVWSGEAWDKLSETYDFSEFATQEEIEALKELYYTKTEVDAVLANLEEVIDQKLIEKVDTSTFESYKEVVDDTMAGQNGNIQSLLLQIDQLQDKIEDLKSLDYEVVTIYDGSDTDLQNEEKSFQLSGLINTRLVVDGENVTLDEATINSAFVEFDAIEDITIKDTTYSGNTPKAMSNAVFKLHADGYVSVRNCTITPEKAYNAIEVGLSQGLAKSVIIDGCTFDGPFTNNAINVFGLDDGGVVTISNCYFKKVSNVLRLSNRTNTSWTVNLINCICDEWELGQYAGMILMQDYTSGSSSAAEQSNQFAKLTINIQNCTKPDGTKIVAPANMADICCTQNDNQILYIWDAWRNFVSYNAEKYPTINII